ncbi:hypothetical protein AB0C07_39135 [Actinoplanes missouriensis]|uniref:hypothetical protein n=1 Tax=Actinoplanes missouriensis TaxID=1866 RepID=UPI0033CC962E
MDRTDRIPQDVDTLVREAAGAMPGYGGDFADLPRIARRQRRRRTAGTVAAAVAVLAVAGIGVTVDRGPDRTVSPPAATSSPDQPPTVAPGPAGAQRLMLDGANGTYQTFETSNTHTTLTDTTLSGATRVGEMTVDGTWKLTTHEVVGADGWDRFVGLADGRIVALGPDDTLPGVQREDGPDVEGLTINLVVTGPDGRVLQSRDVREPGEPVALLGATERYAYLWRPAGLVEHDLATGAEQVRVTPGQLGVTGFFDGRIAAADLVGDRLVIVRQESPCVVFVFDVATGAELTGHDLAGNATCERIVGLRLSPDTSEIAVAYRDGDMLEVTVMDAAGGALSDSTDVPVGADLKQEPAIAVSWVDERTLRGAAYGTGGGPAGLVPFTLTR